MQSNAKVFSVLASETSSSRQSSEERRVEKSTAGFGATAALFPQRTQAYSFGRPFGFGERECPSCLSKSARPADYACPSWGRPE